MGALKNCLKNERILVRFVPKEDSNITNPKHILYGGMAEGAIKYYTVPILASTGTYKNILTDDEKAFLESYMGLEYNALSVYNKTNNFWANFTVRLTKHDNYLDLSDPNDYIKYKVLLANTDFIADSLKTLNDRPKATYQFVMIKEGESEKREEEKMSVTMKCYKEYGKIEDDNDTLRCIIELIDNRPIAKNTKSEFLKSRINSLIQADPKLFYSIITDEYLNNKVLIKTATEEGVIKRRNNLYYFEDTPLCPDGTESTLSVAAEYIGLGKNQDLKLRIEALLNKAKE
ncbi:MAG: hypothetical protein MR346_02455 [Clostridium sp.]|nr:hypothetical protein [Clostridium sp.]